MRSAGIVAIGSADEVYQWTGGHYYLQHLIKCVSSLPAGDRVGLRDVWWTRQGKTDPFLEVRDLLGPPVVVSPPVSLMGRLLRRIRRIGTAHKGAGDLFEPAQIDVFFPSPPCENAGKPFIFWIPDFQHVRRPDLMAERIRDRFERDIAQNVFRASRIVLSSYDAQNDFAGKYPELLDRTDVVRFCSAPDDSWWQQDPAATAAKYGLPERFLMVCNQFTRHKNHLILIEAMKLLADRGREDIHLVCTGSTFDYREEDYIGQVRAAIERYSLGSRVHILGLIPRAEQVALLRRCAAVVQPSSFEGWSTVIEDAKTLGKQVFASSLPVHREQLGDAQPWYLDADNAAEWADAIGQAWDGLAPGPDTARENAGLAAMEDARAACGHAFVSALKAAVGEGRNR